MKKIIGRVLIVISVIWLQVIYIDYRLSKQLNQVAGTQKGIAMEIELLENKTEITSEIWHKTLRQLENRTSNQELKITNRDTLQADNILPIAAAY